MKNTYKIFMLALLLFNLFNVTMRTDKCNAKVWNPHLNLNHGIINQQEVYSLANNLNYIYAGTRDSGIYIYDGLNWTHSQLSKGDVRGIVISGNYLYAGVSNGSSTGSVYVSTNNGMNWTQTPLNNQAVLSLAVEGNTIFAGCYGTGVYKSTNNGTNWTQTSLNNRIIQSIAVNGNIIYAGTRYYGIYLSTDNGSTWTQKPLNDSLMVYVNAVTYNGSNVYAGTDGFGLYLSTNNGMNWTQTSLNNKSIYSLITKDGRIFAGTVDSGVYISTNNGVNWLQKNHGFPVFQPSTTIYALTITNNYIHASVSSLSLWYREYLDIIGIKSISTETPSKYSMEQNYPNPFNPTTSIQFSLPKNEVVSIKIYDMLGKEVANVMNEFKNAGTYEVNFNASALNSGVYFYKMNAGSYSSIKRMVVLK